MDDAAADQQPASAPQPSPEIASTPTAIDTDWSVLAPAEVFKSLQPDNGFIITKEED